MKPAQFYGIMWILCEICYYVSDKEIGALIAAYIFLVAGLLSFFLPERGKDE